MKYQKGSTLLEGMISIMIFSFGMLGTMAFQANMLAQSTQVSYKMSASGHVSSLLSTIDADPDHYTCYVLPVSTDAQCAHAAKYMTSWKTQVEQSMPSAVNFEPYVRVVNDGGTFINVRVLWMTPADKADFDKNGKLDNTKNTCMKNDNGVYSAHSTYKDYSKYVQCFTATSRPIGSA